MRTLIFENGIKLDTVPELKLTPISSDNDDLPKIIVNPPKEATIETDLIFNTFALWYLLTGTKITNNYLKMHGGVIQRYRQFRKIE